MIRKYGRLLLYTCGVPAIAWCILSLVQIHQNSTWMAAVKKDFPQATEQDLAARSLAALCRAPESRNAMGAICSTYDHVASLRLLAVTTIVGTILLLLGVHWIGQRCRRDRQLLLKRFRVGSHLMTAATLILVLSQALLLSTALFFGPVEFLSRIPTGLILLTGLGALLAVYKVVRLIFAFGKEFSVDVDGRFVSVDQAPELWKFVEATAAAVGTDPPRNIVVGTDATFFVTEAKVATNGGAATGRTLYVSIPLCQILTKTEFRSIVGHEMAHFYGRDTDFSRKFYPAFRNGANTLDAVVGTARSVGGGGYALLPAISLLSFYLESFSEAEAEISREREIAADVIGARVTTKRDFALAITKIIQHDSAWEKVYSELLDNSTNEKRELPLPSESFVRVAEQQFRTANRAEQIKQLESEQLAHPTDSHPPLGARLKALGLSVDEVFDAAGDIRPTDASSTLIPNSEALERELFPQFAPKSQEAQTIFCRRQAGFAAMEYYGLILNRSFLVYVCSEGLYGMKFRGLVTSNETRYFDPALDLLDDPWFMPGTDAFQKAMKESRASFFIRRAEIADVEFDSSPKWGMGRIPHAGKLKIRLRSGKRREFILLGEAYGDGIQRFILEVCCGKSAKAGG
jgi:Zn-dependent protease with chaperone function